MENMVDATRVLSSFKNLRVLVTGHTGFKGSWLTSWLDRLGVEVAGLSNGILTTPSHHALLQLDIKEFDIDIRDGDAVRRAVSEFKPDLVFHLAAQSLVWKSYDDPLQTYATNVIGSLNVYEACRKSDSIKALVSATTDKVYHNHEWQWGYREDDTLGGHDPYSASKACVELMTQSYRMSYLKDEGMLVATARAGNVIGGGDWSDNRLLPDLVRSAFAGQPLVIRNPGSIRPWQHVLDPLFGYMCLASRLLEGDRSVVGAWNFGPVSRASITVADIVDALRSRIPSLQVSSPAETNTLPHEAGLLELDSARARTLLGWHPVWENSMLDRTMEWYQTFYETEELSTFDQIDAYVHGLKSRFPVGA